MNNAPSSDNEMMSKDLKSCRAKTKVNHNVVTNWSAIGSDIL